MGKKYSLHHHSFTQQIFVEFFLCARHWGLNRVLTWSSHTSDENEYQSKSYRNTCITQAEQCYGKTQDVREYGAKRGGPDLRAQGRLLEEVGSELSSEGWGEGSLDKG